MQAGRRDRRVTLQRATTVQSALGTEIPSWATLATLWASREAISGVERYRAEQVGATVTARFQVRWNAITSGLRRADRLICEGVTYEITGLKEIGRRVGVEITAAAAL